MEKSARILSIIFLMITVSFFPGCLSPSTGPATPGGNASTSAPESPVAAGPVPAILGDVEHVRNEYWPFGALKSTTVTKYVKNDGDPGDVYLSLTNHYSKNTSSLRFFMDRNEVVGVSYRSGGMVTMSTYDLMVRTARPGDVGLNELTGVLFITRNVSESDYRQ